MESSGSKYYQMNALLRKERALQERRFSIQPVTIWEEKDHFYLIMDNENTKRLNASDPGSVTWDLTEVNSGKEPIRVQIQQSELGRFFIRKPIRLNRRGTYRLAPTNATIRQQLNNLKKMNKNMSQKLLRFIKNPHIEPIDELVFHYDERELQGLNKSQQLSIHRAMTRNICLIKGPPGTGKTTVISRMLEMLIRQKKKTLLCASSNTGVDTAIRSLLKSVKNPTMVTRFYAQRNKKCPADLAELNFMGKVVKYVKEKDTQEGFLNWFEVNLQQAMEKKALITGRHTELQFKRVRYEAYKAVCDSSLIVATTLTTCSINLLEEFYPDVVIIDESSQSTQAEVIGALNHGAEKVILLGDEMQLSPTVISNNAILKKSLFDDIITKRPEAALMLNIQYRMHPQLSCFPSEAFYDRRIQDGIKASDRRSHYPFFQQGPIVIVDAGSSRRQIQEGHSYKNPYQVQLIKRFISETFERSDLKNVGIITGLAPQEELLVKQLQCFVAQGLEIKTFDGSQGDEKDYIIISFVRNNPDGVIGFLAEPNRANVALTRARKGLVLVGNLSTMKSDNGGKFNPWKHFIEYAEKLRPAKSESAFMSKREEPRIKQEPNIRQEFNFEQTSIFPSSELDQQTTVLQELFPTLSPSKNSIQRTLDVMISVPAPQKNVLTTSVLDSSALTLNSSLECEISKAKEQQPILLGEGEVLLPSKRKEQEDDAPQGKKKKKKQR